MCVYMWKTLLPPLFVGLDNKVKSNYLQRNSAEYHRQS